MQITEATPQNAAILRDALQPSFTAYLNAILRASYIRARVNAIELAALDEYPLYDLGSGEKITNPDDAWKADDKSFDAWYAIVYPRVKALPESAGLTDGQCPALVAENNAREKKMDVLRVAAPYLGFNADRASVANLYKMFDKIFVWMTNAGN